MKKISVLITAIIYSISMVAQVGTSFKVDAFVYKITSADEVEVIIAHNRKSIEIPSSVKCKEEIYKVTSIGNSAFSGCKSLQNITIPNSVTSIEGYAFKGCI